MAPKAGLPMHQNRTRPRSSHLARLDERTPSALLAVPRESDIVKDAEQGFSLPSCGGKAHPARQAVV